MTIFENMVPHSVVETGCGSAAPLEKVGSGGAVSGSGGRAPNVAENRYVNRARLTLTSRGFGMSKKSIENRKSTYFPSRLSRDRETARQAVIDEMKSAIREIAGPYGPGELEAARARAARRIGLTDSEAYRIWYGIMRIIPAPVADAVRACLADVRASAHPRSEDAVSEIRERLERLERVLSRQAGVA